MQSGTFPTRAVLLTNVTYIGKIKYKDEVHTGEHPSIVDIDFFRRVQTALQRNGRSGGVLVRNRYGALLEGLLRCAFCDCTMGHTFSARGNRRYRYYVCLQAQKRGWHECPSPSVSAGEIEQFIVEEIKCIGRDPAVIAETVKQVRRLSQERCGFRGRRSIGMGSFRSFATSQELRSSDELLTRVYEFAAARPTEVTVLCERNDVLLVP